MKPFFIITDVNGDTKHLIEYHETNPGKPITVDRFETAEKAIDMLVKYQYNGFVCKVEPVFHVKVERSTRTIVDPLL